MTRPTRSRASFSFFLHGHLPWVTRHGRWPHGVEWLHEATLATYLPLLAAGRRLRERGIAGGLTISISPILAEQLGHPLFRGEMAAYVDERIRTSAEESLRFDERGDAELARLAERARDNYAAARHFLFDTLGGDILGGFADLDRSGTIELATCGATHGYFPLLSRDETIALQVRLARRTHERRFGAPPRGLWLPEAAYRPAGWWSSPSDGSQHLRCGVEEFLGREGIGYVIVDSALLTGGRAIGTYFDRLAPGGVPAQDTLDRAESPVRVEPAARVAGGSELDTRASYWIARAGGAPAEVACFVRDPGTALQVWSRDRGYPGDPAYLEFHKKSDGGGHRYWRVTGPEADLGDKAIYDPEAAAERVRAHADHFAQLVRTTLAGAPEGAILVAPFDAELFGHWWAEGVEWLTGVLVRLAAAGDVELATLGAHLDRVPPERVVSLPEGSWGAGGRHDVWMNPSVAWTWPLVHRAEDEVWALVARARRSSSSAARRLAVAALRQLLLLCASDWQFLITTGSAVDYAANRLRLHADDTLRLAELGRKALAGRELTAEETAFVDATEARDDPFPDLAAAVSLDAPLRASGVSDSREARSVPREAFADHFRRGPLSIPGE